MATTLYEVLGIPLNANQGEIKAAYRRLARTCHPDAVSFKQKEASADEFMKIHDAYSTLSDPDKRANYDRRIDQWQPIVSSSIRMATASASASTRVTTFSGYSCRNWETDQCW